MAPDRRHRPGFIPPQAHVLHEADGPHQGMEPVVRRLEAWLVHQPNRDSDWWFHLGRLGHLLGDLCQPLHTATSASEKAMHSRYERYAASLPWGKRDERGGTGLPREDPASLSGDPAVSSTPYPKALKDWAREGRREYEPLVRRFGERDSRPWLFRRTQIWRWRAVVLVAQRFERVCVANQKPSRAWPWRWLVLWWLWLDLLNRRMDRRGFAP